MLHDTPPLTATVDILKIFNRPYNLQEHKVSIPLPPGYKATEITVPSVGNAPAITPTQKTEGLHNNRTAPPQEPDPKALVKHTKMTIADTTSILDLTLIPQHRTDPNVIRFIKNYLICRDVKQAAEMGGLTRYDGENLKRRPDIHDAIAKITDAAVLKHGYDASEVVERVKEISRVDPGDLENPDGTYKRMRDIPPELRRAIKRMKVKNTYSMDPNGIKVANGEIIEIEFWDKMKAVELLGREKELFKETKKVEHDLGKNMSSVLLDSKRIAEQHIRDVGEQSLIEHKPVGEIIEATVINEGE
jgi:hypothetical protein